MVALASVPEDKIPKESLKYVDLYKDIPLMIKEKGASGECKWRVVTLRKLADELGLEIGVFFSNTHKGCQRTRKRSGATSAAIRCYPPGLSAACRIRISRISPGALATAQLQRPKPP